MAREEVSMTFWEHLEELRRRLLRSVLALLCGAGISWLYRERILEWVSQPYVHAWKAGTQASLHFAAPADLFMAYLKLAFLGAFAADPGLVKTDMGFKETPALARWIWDRRRRGGISPEESAEGVAFLAVEPSIQDAPEIYWKHAKPKPPNPYALDEAAAGRLWELSSRMCAIAPGTYGQEQKDG